MKKQKCLAFWDGNTGNRCVFTNWGDNSTGNPRTIEVAGPTTVTAYFNKKWCPGDCNGDGIVRYEDLSILSSNWYNEYPDP